MNNFNFPKGFLWGTATAAFQIEGSPYKEGKARSIWDDFTDNPNNIADGSNANIACDHYNLYKEDVNLMSDLSLNAYRFSISWPRIISDKSKKMNQSGVDFYKKLIDELLEKNIRPFPTLFHWDLPSYLEDMGGFLNKDISNYFADYAFKFTDVFKDRITNWTTLNEPFSFIQHGYLTGIHAPGKVGIKNVFKASHTLNLAHAKAYDAIKSHDNKLNVGLTNIITPVHANSRSDEKATINADDFFNKLFLDPFYFGKYPSYIHSRMRLLNFDYKVSEVEFMKSKIDFIGLNNYFRLFVKKSFNPLMPFKFYQNPSSEVEKTNMGWEVYPEGLYESIRFVTNRYNNPLIYITENGACFKDELIDDKVEDLKRIEFLEKYLKQTLRAIKEGSKVEGYFLWTLMDNFEWAAGNSKRFGIVYTDFKTQKRYLKDSAKWYKKVSQSNSLSI